MSILKPVTGMDRGAEENFASYLSQDYPDYEVLFGVLDPDDPAIDLLQNQRLFIGTDIDGANNKVRILSNLARHATGDILIITDADTRVHPDFIKRIVRPFKDESVGLVTCFYRGTDGKTIADALEGLHMTCAFAPGVATSALWKVDFGLGAAIAIRRTVLHEIGGFEAIADYIADDFQLGYRTSRAGYKEELSDYVMEDVLGGASLKEVISREHRWSRTTRVSRPLGHIGLFATFGLAYAVAFLILSGFNASGWIIFCASTTVRVACAKLGAGVLLDDRELNRRLWLLPLRDVLSLAIWFLSYLPIPVRWRGRTLRVKRDGRLESV